MESCNIYNNSTKRRDRFRIVNLFTEDHAALTGARDVYIVEDLNPEESYNISLNINHVFTLGSSSGTIDFDAFYTHFKKRFYQITKLIKTKLFTRI